MKILNDATTVNQQSKSQLKMALAEIDDEEDENDPCNHSDTKDPRITGMKTTEIHTDIDLQRSFRKLTDFQ